MQSSKIMFLFLSAILASMPVFGFRDTEDPVEKAREEAAMRELEAASEKAEQERAGQPPPTASAEEQAENLRLKKIVDSAFDKCSQAHTNLKTRCTTAKNKYTELIRRLDAGHSITYKMLSEKSCGYDGILDKIAMVQKDTEDRVKTYIGKEAKSCGETIPTCKQACNPTTASTGLDQGWLSVLTNRISLRMNGKHCYDPSDPQMYSPSNAENLAGRIETERKNVERARDSLLPEKNGGAKVVQKPEACDDEHSKKLVELFQKANPSDADIGGALADYGQRFDNTQSQFEYAGLTRAPGTYSASAIYDANMNVVTVKNPYDYASSLPAGLATDVDNRRVRDPSTSPPAGPPSGPGGKSNDAPSGKASDSGFKQKDLQGIASAISSQLAASSANPTAALSPPQIPITDCSRDPSSPQCCIPGSGNCNRYDPNQHSARAKGPNAGESESGGSASAPAPLEVKKKSSIAEMLASLASSVTRSSALPADPGNSGIAENGGSGEGKQAGAKAAKKVGGTSANDAENQVYNGRLGSPKAVAGAYPKERGIGGAPADSNSKAALTDSPAEPVNYLALLPRGLKRRIMGAQGHPEIAGKFENLFENLNRAYRNKGPTLGPAVIQLSAIDLK